MAIGRCQDGSDQCQRHAAFAAVGTAKKVMVAGANVTRPDDVGNARQARQIVGIGQRERRAVEPDVAVCRFAASSVKRCAAAAIVRSCGASRSLLMTSRAMPPGDGALAMGIDMQPGLRPARRHRARRSHQMPPQQRAPVVRPGVSVVWSSRP